MTTRPLIGVIIADCHVDFQAEILRGIIAQAYRSNCDVAVIAPLHSFYADSVHKNAEKAIFDLILSDRFAGFIYDRNSFYSDAIKEHIDSVCTRSGKPVMLLDAGGHKNFETTSVDDCDAFETITDHLIEEHGYKRIYCFTGPKKDYSAEERLKGYMNSMKRHSLHFDRSYYEYGDFWTMQSKAYAERIVSGELPRPDAIVCGNDISAIAITKALMAGGINVPADIAVTGYDASMDGYRFSPSITSYTRPNYQLGAEAFRRLYRILTGKICARVPNENGSLRLGRSCGCLEEPKLRRSIQRAIQINSDRESYMFYGDMLYELSSALNVKEFADTLARYTFFLYKYVRVSVCLTRRYLDALDGSYNERLSFRFGEDMSEALSQSFVGHTSSTGTAFSSADILPAFSSRRSYPTAYYISPLHYNDNFFGYIGLCFGKEPMSFAKLYIQWINNVNIALEQIRIKSIMTHLVTNTNKVLLYDDTTGLLNTKGMMQAFNDRFLSDQRHSEVHIISVELSGLKKTYYQSGDDKCQRIFRGAARALNECLHEGEMCSKWKTSVMLIFTFEPSRENELFSRLSMMMKESQFDGENSFNVEFSMGQNTVQLTPELNLSDAIHKAIINKIHAYTLSDNTANPQFEKLCMLRSRIMKNPEMAWNISEIAESLYLSKSYLQKIYKSYFNKSIIEEMIEFRINKAKDLLIQTGLTITEIARECGYSSYNYFVRQFRSSEGVSPSEFRDAHTGSAAT